MSFQTRDRHFLTKKIIARRNGVHPGTIDRWVRQGQYPKPIKLSKKGGCRWPEAVIVAWEEAQLAEVKQSIPTIFSGRSAQ